VATEQCDEQMMRGALIVHCQATTAFELQTNTMVLPPPLNNLTVCRDYRVGNKLGEGDAPVYSLILEETDESSFWVIKVSPNLTPTKPRYSANENIDRLLHARLHHE
jgi:hypothetical protein